VVNGDEPAPVEANPLPERKLWIERSLDGSQTVKAKVFEVILHKLPCGKSPASELEEQLNRFLAERPGIQVVATHMNTIVAPAEPDAMPSSEASSIIIFLTVFYAGSEPRPAALVG
jgi:hypothetical protein